MGKVRAEYSVSEEQPHNVVFFDLPKVISDVSQAVLHNTEDGMYYHTTYLEQSGAQRHKAKESKWSITSIVQHQIDTQTQLAGALKENCENHDIFFCIPSVLLKVIFLYENNEKEYEHHLELYKDRGISLCILCWSGGDFP